jgi:hypothetical protein
VGYYAHCGLNLSKPCVACTFENLISASPYLKLTTSGIPLGGQAVKHRHPPLGISSQGLSTMVIPHWSVAPLVEATGVGGTTTTSAMRVTHPRVATTNKKYNNPLATSMGQGTMAKIKLRPTSIMLPRSTSGKKSMRAATRSLLLKQGGGTVPAGTTTMTTATAYPPSPPASPTSPTQGLQTSRNPQV